jgi:hypothetical protein
MLTHAQHCIREERMGVKGELERQEQIGRQTVD